MRIALTLALIAAVNMIALAQPPNSSCATAAVLCAQQPLSGNNTGSTSVPGFCPATAAAVWYSFTTNSVGGPVTVTVDDIDCPTVAGMDDELSVVVLSGDGSCTLASFTGASTCALGDVTITLTSLALMANRQYWILISGAMNNGATIAAQCGFTVNVEGPGATIIGVDVSAGPDVIIGEGESTQLQGIGPNYDWSPTSGLSGNGIPDPIAAPSGTTIYTLTSTANGCTYVDTVIVELVRRIDPPNTFTPNGDGINDTWEIPGMADYPGAEVTIHDRWGQKVYSANGYREPWDGTNNGKNLGVGTYYYHIKLNQLEGRSPPYTGFITIIR